MYAITLRRIAPVAAFYQSALGVQKIARSPAALWIAPTMNASPARPPGNTVATEAPSVSAIVFTRSLKQRAIASVEQAKSVM